MIDIKKLGEFISDKIMGCKFVGLSSDNEVFVEFDHADKDLELVAARTIRKMFPNVTQVTIVIKPSITEIQKMVDDLNRYLEKDSSKKKDLLDIESF